jgi:hypothetical protein
MQAVSGIAANAPNRKDSSVVVARHGTRLTQRGCVQGVDTNGAGPPACAAVSGLCTKSGTKTTAVEGRFFVLNESESASQIL